MLLDSTGQPGRPPRSDRRSGRGTLAAVAALTAVLCVLAVWAAYRVFVVSPAGRWIDQLVMDSAQRGRSTLWLYAEQVLEPVSVAYGAIGLVVVVTIGALRRRWRLAVLGAMLLGASTITTQVLKRELLTRPALADGLNEGNSLPSGHTTAAAATCAALLFVVSPRWRPVVAVLGVVYTVLTGWSTYVGHWHRPADVLAAVAVVTGWSAVACLLLIVPAPAGPGPVDPDVGRRLTRWTLVLLAAVAVVSTVVLVFVGVALSEAVGGTWGGEAGRRAQLLAYGGGVVATAGWVSAMVAVQLALRTAVGRVRSDR